MRAGCFLFRILVVWVTVVTATAAEAHQASDSYLRLHETAAGFEGTWDIALVDLELAMGLDADGNGELTWGELRSRHDEVASFALAHLNLHRGSVACKTEVQEQLVDHHADIPYTVLRFLAHCPRQGEVRGSYKLFFDLDPGHRGLLSWSSAGAAGSAVLAPKRSQFHFAQGRSANPGQVAVDFLRQGVIHIWIGYDHILFLLTLLLPAVVSRRHDRWQGVDSLGTAALEVLKVVTAFTVAHSLTLIPAALKWVELASAPVETAIALTVVLAALNNLWPVVSGERWGLAFALGLVHGFGFAGVLSELGLPSQALAVALASFNVGVELGQLAIVAVFLPVAYWLRHTWFYRRAVYQLGSLLVAMVAMYWLLERGLGLSLWPVIG